MKKDSEKHLWDDNRNLITGWKAPKIKEKKKGDGHYKRENKGVTYADPGISAFKRME